MARKKVHGRQDTPPDERSDEMHSATMDQGRTEARKFDATMMIRIRTRDNKRLAVLAAMHDLKHMDMLSILLDRAWAETQGRLIDPAEKAEDGPRGDGG